MGFQGKIFDNERREKREKCNTESGKKKAGIHCVDPGFNYRLLLLIPV
jgi:hypothetical protein